MEKATHQPLMGLDATDGNLWSSLASVRAHRAATEPPRALTPEAPAAAAAAAAAPATELTVCCED